MSAPSCGKRVELGNTGVPVTYCILKLGHEGKCKPDEGLRLRYEGPKKEKEKE